MFELDFAENKAILQNMMNVHNVWMFKKGVITSLHKQEYVCVIFENHKIDVDKPSLHKVDELSEILSSKTIVKAKINTNSGHVIVEHPYTMVLDMPRIESETEQEWKDKHLAHLAKAYQLENTEDNTWTDKFGKKHDVCKFLIDSVEFADMLARAGETNMLEILVNENLMLRNYDTNGKVKRTLIHKNINAEVHGHIFLAKDGHNSLDNAILGDTTKTTVIIANDAVIMAKNKHKTTIAARVTEG